MKIFKPVVNKFKEAFFGGDEEDSECNDKKPAKARPGAKKTAAPKKTEVISRQQIAVQSSDEEEVK